MLHFVARSVRHHLVFHTWEEAHALWTRLVERVPMLVALCLMPDHLHLLARQDVGQPLGDALRSYANWRNARRGQQGPVFDRRPPPSVVVGRLKEQRNLRYIHLNPCRGRLVRDPLAWPFSTHRDAVGLATWPARAVSPDPHDLHQYVSADPEVAVEGTLLPCGGGRLERVEQLQDLSAAVSALTRTPLSRLEQRGPGRTLLLRSAVCLSSLPLETVARELGSSRPTLQRARARGLSPQVRMVEQVLGDRRFAALDDRDLRRQPSWRRFRWHR